MSKTVLKLRPNDYWRIGEHESWFADMAKQGLHLKKTGVLFAHFEKGEPKNTKYRIDVTRGGISYERNNLYSEYGWNYVTSYGKFCVFSSPEELEVTELHTEPVEQSHTLSTLDKELRLSVIIVSITLTLFFAMMFGIIFLSSTPYENLVTGQSFQQLILVIVETYVLFTTIQAWLSIRFLRRQLSEGTPINHHANWRKSRRINYTISLILIILSLITILLPVMSMVKSETAALPAEKAKLPIVRLAEIENNSDLERNPGYASDGIDRFNQYSLSWSPFAPVQIETDEHGLVTGKWWKDGSGEYTPSIHSQYYQLRFPGMADGLLKDLMSRYLYEESQRVQLQKIESDVFDQLYVMVDEEENQIFASHDNKVLYIRYYGYTDINQILTLAEKL